jgi:uncharacterized delta-60 repeat protein
MKLERLRPVPLVLVFVAAVWAAGRPLAAADGYPDLDFNANGAREIAWNHGGNDNDFVGDVAADSDGNLFVVGYLTSETTDYDWGIVRIDVHGNVLSRSLYFDLGGTNNDEAGGVVLDGAGGVVVAGSVDTATSRDLRVCRFAADTLATDTSFGNGGCGSFSAGSGEYFSVRGIARSGDGGFIVGGTITQPGPDNDFFAVKFAANGTPDSNFGFFGIRVVRWDYQTNGSDSVNALAVDRNGEILLAGTAQHPTYGHVFAVAKLTAAGNLDTGFAGGSGMLAFSFTGPYFATAVTVVPTNGTDFVAGAVVDNGNGTSTAQIAYFDAAGDQVFFPGTISHILDETWNAATTNYISRLVYQSDGKLLVVGSSSIGTTYQVSRLNATGGGLDSTYGLNGVATYSPGSWAEGTGAYTRSAALSGGRIVVVGDTLDPDRNWLVLRLTNSLIFRDGFETGDTRGWSAF